MLQRIKQWIKAQNNPITRCAYPLLKNLRYVTLPGIKIVYIPLYAIHCFTANTIRSILRICYWTPIFKTRLQGKAPRLYLYGGMPTLMGPLQISMGNQCRVGGSSVVIMGRSNNTHNILQVGNNVDIGWENLIAVAGKVSLGNNVRMAEGVSLLGFPGHPEDPAKRAQGLPDNDNQVGEIIIEQDVWLATRCTVLAGVTIGQGSIIATGSIVTHDIPANVLAAGSPAKVIRTLDNNHE